MNLQFRPSLRLLENQYIYTWRTAKSMKGNCYRFDVELDQSREKKRIPIVVDRHRENGTRMRLSGWENTMSRRTVPSGSVLFLTVKGYRANCPL